VDTVQTLEVVFGAAALVGLLFSAVNIRDATLDLRALRAAAIRNGRRWVALSMLFLESIRAAIQLIHIAIAYLAMTLPAGAGPPPGTPARVLLYGDLIAYGLIASAALVSVLSVGAWAWRRWFPWDN
jgi:hypothetical protein